MAHTFTNLLTHLIFSTKDRRPMLDDTLRERLFPYVSGIFRELGGTVITMNGPIDHVHILALLPADKAIAEIMRLVKTNSSRWVHENFAQHKTFSWQIGYGAFAVSQSHRDDVCKYITAQQEHHRQTTFEEEFLTFLEKHGIEYDPKYLWR